MECRLEWKICSEYNVERGREMLFGADCCKRYVRQIFRKRVCDVMTYAYFNSVATTSQVFFNLQCSPESVLDANRTSAAQWP